MPTRLPADLLRRSPEEGSRLLALAHLEEIASVDRRLAEPPDPEALHDFRVGLRRLRSCIRAYRSQLKGSVSKKVRRRLGDLTVATNPGRDIEVQLGWLHRQAERLGPSEIEGLAWLIGRLEGRKSELGGAAEMVKDFSKVAPKLRGRLETFRIEVKTGREQKRRSFGEVTGGLILGHAAELAESLEAVAAPEDATKAHAARIRAKRLRYLLEPLSGRARRVKALVGQLKQLQDLLGHLHDMQVLAGEIDASLAALSRNVPDRAVAAEPGLRTLRRLADDEAKESFARFRAAWADGHADRFLRLTTEVGNHLAKPPQPAERAVPPHPGEKPIAAAPVALVAPNEGQPTATKNSGGGNPLVALQS
jgi:CHAD domain-containing protein